LATEYDIPKSYHLYEKKKRKVTLVLFTCLSVLVVLIQYPLQDAGRGLWSNMLLVDWACT